MKDAFEILASRGFVYQCTDEDSLRRELGEGRKTFYVGFDPTASSLHIGHLLPVMAMRWLQRAGHRPIALVGGGTGMIGDPSGKTEARPVLTREQIEANAEGIRRQLSRFLDFDEDEALLLNNADWLAPLNYIDFLRDVGRYFSVNRMLSAESVKQRLETGLSFLEFNYSLLQSYDFSVLYERYGCTLQLGGQDQWGNIVAGVDLTRRMHSAQVNGVTFPLLLKSDGTKFGKTASGAVWLDPGRTTPFEYYQFWRNVDDSEVGRLLAFFTSLPMKEVRQLSRLSVPAINRAKEILAYEATRLAHGREDARKAYLSAGGEFGFADRERVATSSSTIEEIEEQDLEKDLPTHAVEPSSLGEGIWVVKLLTDTGLCSTNSEARRLIRGGGGYINDQRIADERSVVSEEDLENGEIMLRAGKKRFCRIVAS